MGLGWRCLKVAEYGERDLSWASRKSFGTVHKCVLQNAVTLVGEAEDKMVHLTLMSGVRNYRGFPPGGGGVSFC